MGLRGYRYIRRERGYRGLQTIDPIESLDQQLYSFKILGGSVQVGDLVQSRLTDLIGIVLDYGMDDIVKVRWLNWDGEVGTIQWIDAEGVKKLTEKT